MGLKDFVRSLAVKAFFYFEAFSVKEQGYISSSQISYYLSKWGLDNVEVLDSEYSTMKKEDMEKLLRLNYSRLRSYKPDIFDCDNYGFVLKGILDFVAYGFAHGIIFVKTPHGKHFLNFFFDDNNQLFYVEPQDNNIFSFRDGSLDKGYIPYFALI